MEGEKICCFLGRVTQTFKYEMCIISNPEKKNNTL